MRKLILIAHTSLDGYVANENGSFENFSPGKDNLEFVCSVTADADTFVGGRVSYQLLQSNWPTAYLKPEATKDEVAYSKWYNAAQKIVISKTFPDTKASNMILLRGNLLEEITAIKNKPGKNLLLFGSPSTFQSLLSLGLIDACWLIVYPAIFGKGIPLFRPEEKNWKLQLETTKQLLNGEMALYYSMKK